MRLFPLATTALLMMTAAAHAGNGCPDGSFSVTNSPDNLATTILFSDFLATAGGGTGVTQDTSTCVLSVPPKSTEGFSVYSADYRGFVFIGDGQTVTVEDLVSGTTLKSVSGPNGDELVVSGRFSTTPGTQLAIDTALTLDTGSNPDEGQAGIDSLDLLLIGFTSSQSVQDSIDRLAQAHKRVVSGVATSADLLLGALEPIESGDYAGLFAAAGSASMAGATGTLDLSEGFSIRGGLSSYSQHDADVSASGLLLAGAARYVFGIDEQFDLFGEAGAYGSPNLGLGFTRRYENNAAPVTIASTTNGSLAAIYLRAGAVYRPDDSNEFAVSTTVSRNWLNVASYSEDVTADNLFAATVSGHTINSAMIKATVAWTGKMSDQLDLTLSAAAGYDYGASGHVGADIDFVGNVSGISSDMAFVEYGARAGWEFTSAATASVFVYGRTDANSGTQLTFGAILKASF